MRSAAVYLKGILAGFLIEEHRNAYIFRYDAKYLGRPDSESISLTLPKRQMEYRAETMFPFFSNMIAEGTNLSLQSIQLKIDEDDEMGLLLSTAQHDTIGAITLRPYTL